MNAHDYILPTLTFLTGGCLATLYYSQKLSKQKLTHKDELQHQQLLLRESTLMQESLDTRYKELLENHEQMRQQFKILAVEELQQKSHELRDQNKEQLHLLLAPLRERLEQLDDHMTKNRLAGEKNKTVMEELTRHFMEKADKIGADAVELTRALRGNSKLQGDWGEMILESILSHAGLRKGVEYDTQCNFKNAKGDNLRPDLILSYPQGQRLIIDAKVSLTAYTRLVNSYDDDEREQQLKLHLQSVRGHIKELAAKNYPTVVPDSFPYVLLFIPNEGAHIEALQAAPELLEEAQRQHILLASPTNLLMSVKLCYYLWQRERQNKNLEHIVKECAEIYHKFITLINCFAQIDKSLAKVKSHYDDAYKLLATGRGNITHRLDQLRQLGVTPSKQIPEDILSEAQRAESSHEAAEE